MSTAGRPLLAATGSTGDDYRSGAGGSPSGPNQPAGPSRPKRTLIESACQACRRRKSKCNGLRPVCSKCESLGSECLYETEEGESRWAALRRRNVQLERERELLGESLEWMRDCPEVEALAVLERVRTTQFDKSTAPDTLIEVVQSFRRGRPHAPTMTQQAPYSQSEQRLPPINVLLAGDTHSAVSRMTTAHVTQSFSIDIEQEQSILMTDMTAMSAGRNRVRLETLEPSLRREMYAASRTPTLSSEESSGTPGLGTAGTATLKREDSSAGALDHPMTGISGHMGMPPQYDSEESLRRSGSYNLPRRVGY
jgi:hypothetical protein